MFSSSRSSAGYKSLVKLVNQYLRATFVLTRIPKDIEEDTLLSNNVRDQTRFEAIAQTFFEPQDFVRHPGQVDITFRTGS